MTVWQADIADLPYDALTPTLELKIQSQAHLLMMADLWRNAWIIQLRCVENYLISRQLDVPDLNFNLPDSEKGAYPRSEKENHSAVEEKAEDAVFFLYRYSFSVRDISLL